jgi:DNA-binding CsgD family transcriptional regulator
VRNRLFRQLRTDLGLKEATVVDATGRKRFELQPKLARAPFELAMAQVDALADPCRLHVERESLRELLRAYESAQMSQAARRVLEWRLAGTPGKEMARRLSRSEPPVYAILREARQAVRDALNRIREGLN